MSDESDRPVVDIKDIIDSKFISGEGVLLINPDMDDKIIAFSIREALRAVKGKSFAVAESAFTDRTPAEHHAIIGSTKDGMSLPKK